MFNFYYAKIMPGRRGVLIGKCVKKNDKSVEFSTKMSNFMSYFLR